MMTFEKINLTAIIADYSKSIVINLGFKQISFVCLKFNMLLKIEADVYTFLSDNKLDNFAVDNPLPTETTEYN